MTYSLSDHYSSQKRQGLSGMMQSAIEDENRRSANKQLKQNQKQNSISNITSGALIGAQAGGPVGAVIGGAVGGLISLF